MADSSPPMSPSVPPPVSPPESPPMPPPVPPPESPSMPPSVPPPESPSMPPPVPPPESPSMPPPVPPPESPSMPPPVPSPMPSTSAVTFDPKSETVVLPGGVVSVTGITVVTGGAELSWGSCLLAFGVWGTLIGLSVVPLGLWNVSLDGGTSHLLYTGLVVLFVSSSVVISVAVCRFLRRKGILGEREDEVVLVGERSRGCVKTVTV